MADNSKLLITPIADVESPEDGQSRDPEEAKFDRAIQLELIERLKALGMGMRSLSGYARRVGVVEDVLDEFVRKGREVIVLVTKLRSTESSIACRSSSDSP